MSTLLEEVDQSPTRRRFLRRLTGASAGLFAGIAAAGADDAAAYPYACCALASNTHCSGCSTGSFSCPSGYNKKYWFCCQSGQLYGCGECTHGSSCYIGPWVCSCGYRASGPCAG